MVIPLSLTPWGWQAFFQQQLTLHEWEHCEPARILEQHKSLLEIVTATGRQELPILHTMPPLTVGDWILLTAQNGFVRALERKTCFRRKAAGSRIAEQLLAANVDTAFIVCSVNEDFNLNRIERYLSIAHEAGAEAVVVLSKKDLHDNPDHLRNQVQQLDNQLAVELINCLDPNDVAGLQTWCQPGKTIVMLGSSGAGKSTLTNTLLGETLQTTAAIRDDDSKGRHTTTRRSLLAMPNGAMLLDTPGMRELQLADCEDGLAATFTDIESLAQTCRFSDCQHESEPGCAVLQAVNNGILTVRRLTNYKKLLREQTKNAASLAERRAGDRQLGKYYKKVQKESSTLKRDT